MRTMTCRHTVNAMMDYVDGVLPAPRSLALERHLERCPRCVEFLAAYRAVPGIIRRATEARLPASGTRRLRLALAPASLPPRR